MDGKTDGRADVFTNGHMLGTSFVQSTQQSPQKNPTITYGIKGIYCFCCSEAPNECPLVCLEERTCTKLYYILQLIFESSKANPCFKELIDSKLVSSSQDGAYTFLVLLDINLAASAETAHVHSSSDVRSTHVDIRVYMFVNNYK